jgi:glycosyltransferase involved in cell wall biosynthesis
MLLDPDELERIRIHWYGRMPEEAQLDRSTKKALESIRSNGLKKVIRFYPPSQNIETAVSRADAVGLFSLYEGLPNSICEEMAMAKPAVCSTVSDIPQFLSHEPGLLFDPTEPRSIAGALRHLIGMDSRQLQQVGRQNERIAQEMFHRDSIVSEYLKLLGA